MTKLPRDVSGDDLVRALQKGGWYRDHQVGGHMALRHREVEGKKLVVPVHPGKPLKPKTLQRILKEANITNDQIRELL